MTLADARAIARAVPAFVSVVGVFVNQDAKFVAEACTLGVVPQFSGDESPEFCAAAETEHRYIKAIHVERTAPDVAEQVNALADRYSSGELLFDSRFGHRYGGTGIAFNWFLIEQIVRRRNVIVGGGLIPENVGECVTAVRPYGVDVRSGVETDDRKDPKKMRAFVRAVRESDARA